MKKTYISPVSMITVIETEQLICDSIRVGGNDADKGRTDLSKDREPGSEPAYGNLW